MGGGPSDAEIEKKEKHQAAEQKRRSQELVDQFQSARDVDLAKGRARGQEEFGEGSLGRLNAERNADIANVIARRRAALEGFSPEERNAMESQAIGGINQSAQSALRQLRGVQGAQGLRGGTAAAQQAGVLQNAANQEAQARQNLFLQDVAARRGALDSFEQGVMDREKFNIEQINREKLGRLGTEFGYAGLGVGERTGAHQAAMGEQMAAAARMQAAKNQGKK